MQLTHQVPQAQTSSANIRATSTPRTAGRFGPAALWRWTRHYLEMVAAMFAGMLLLGIAVSIFGRPPGYDTLLGYYEGLQTSS